MSNVDTFDADVRCVFEDTSTIELRDPIAELGIVNLVARDSYDEDNPQSVVLALDLGAAQDLIDALQRAIVVYNLRHLDEDVR